MVFVDCPSRYLEKTMANDFDDNQTPVPVPPQSQLLAQPMLRHLRQ